MPDPTHQAPAVALAAGLAIAAVAVAVATVRGRRALRVRRRAAAEARLAQHFTAQLRAAADMAISERRRVASPEERAEVLVADVLVPR